MEPQAQVAVGQGRQAAPERIHDQAVFARLDFLLALAAGPLGIGGGACVRGCGLEAALLERGFAEGQHRVGHLRDLVAAAGIDRHVEIAGRHLPHGVREADDGLRDAAADDEAEAAAHS